MPMYKLTPLFESDFNVHPKDICYKIRSFHQDNSSTSTTQNKVEHVENDPVKALEQKQAALIEKLKKQTENLNKLLEILGKSSTTTTSNSKVEKKAAPAKAAAAPSTADAAPKDGKKDKDAKKEARKAAKADAKNKAPTTSGDKKGKADTTTKGWIVEDDRKTWETGLTLTVNIPASFTQYQQEELGNVTLNITSIDEPWIKLLSVIGQKRNVSFTGKVSNKVSKAKTTIAVNSGKDFSITIDKVTIKSRQTAWKIIGGALGLYSRQSSQTLNAAHQSLWFEKANQILIGNGDVTLFEREASQFLARFDSLSSQWEVTMADIVFRSLLKSSTQPNNVEIWAKRIDQLIAV